MANWHSFVQIQLARKVAVVQLSGLMMRPSAGHFGGKENHELTW